MNVLGFTVVVVFVLLTVATVAKMIVEMLATLEGMLSLFIFLAAMLGLVVAANKF